MLSHKKVVFATILQIVVDWYWWSSGGYKYNPSKFLISASNIYNTFTNSHIYMTVIVIW